MRDKILLRKKIVVVFLFVLITGVILVYFGFKNKNTNTDLAPVILKDSSFDGQIRDYNNVYKKTLLAISNKQKKETERGMQEVLAYWLQIEKNFLKNKPKEYITTRQWEEKINSITEINKLASDLVKQEKYKEAFTWLELVRKKIKQLREENRIKNISNNFLSLSDEIEKFVKIEKREEAIKNLIPLKINFIEIKEYYPGDQEFQGMLYNFAEVISDIENSSDTTYIKNRNRLEPVFLEIYLKFG